MNQQLFREPKFIQTIYNYLNYNTTNTNTNTNSNTNTNTNQQTNQTKLKNSIGIFGLKLSIEQLPLELVYYIRHTILPYKKFLDDNLICPVYKGRQLDTFKKLCTWDKNHLSEDYFSLNIRYPNLFWKIYSINYMNYDINMYLDSWTDPSEDMIYIVYKAENSSYFDNCIYLSDHIYNDFKIWEKFISDLLDIKLHEKGFFVVEKELNNLS
jgi:hypothetical protein